MSPTRGVVDNGLRFLIYSTLLTLRKRGLNLWLGVTRVAGVGVRLLH